MTKAETVFENELAMIRNPAIRNFVVLAFENLVPEYFWTVATSLSGKYHPAISLGDGGLVRHTKLAVWWGSELMKMYDLSEDGEDCVIAALLLHDGMKNGPEMRNGRATIADSTATHGLYFADKLIEFAAVKGCATTEWIIPIIRGVREHMGRWTASHQGEATAMSRLVHAADYCASRKVDLAIAQISESVQ